METKEPSRSIKEIPVLTQTQLELLLNLSADRGNYVLVSRKDISTCDLTRDTYKLVADGLLVKRTIACKKEYEVYVPTEMTWVMFNNYCPDHGQEEGVIQ